LLFDAAQVSGVLTALWDRNSPRYSNPLAVTAHLAMIFDPRI